MSSRWSLSPSFLQNRQNESNQQLIATYTEDELRSLKTLSIVSYLPAFMCWLEKFIIIIDYFQIFGIIWNTSQPWPWPYQWLYLTRVLNYINFDFYSLTSEGALLGRSQSITIPRWGRMQGYVYYALAFAIVAAFLAAIFAILRHPTERYGKFNFQYRTHILGALGLLMYIFYTPVLLALLRLFYCENWQEVGIVLSADPDLQCLHVSHVIVTFISSLLALPLLAGVPYALYTLVEKNRIYNDSHDHEKRIQLWEMLYMWQLDHYWLDGYVWIQSSFKRYGAFYYFHITLLKISILLCFIALRSNYIAQASMMTVAILWFVMYYVVWGQQRPFRSVSTNLIFVLVCALLMFEIFFGLANANEVRNAVVVASTESICFIVVNTIAFVVIAGVCVYDAVVPAVIDWPTMRTLQRILLRHDILPQVAAWVDCYRESQHILHDFLLSPIEVADVQALEASIRRLRICGLQARSKGSLLDIALNELMETMLLVHSSRYLFAYRKHDHWDRAYEENIAQGVFERREKFVHLMNPRKHSLLLRLLAYRAVRGDHIQSGKFDLTLARKYERHLKFQEELRLRKRHQRRGSDFDSGIEATTSTNDRRRSTFSLFQKNAKLFFDQNVSMSSLHSKKLETFRDDEEEEETDKEDDEDIKKKKGDETGEGLPEEEEVNFYDERGLPNMARFSAEFISEAANMIQRLQERTELALNKHHEASKSLYEQQRLLFLHHLRKQQQQQQQQQQQVSGTNADVSTAATAAAAKMPSEDPNISQAAIQAAVQAAAASGSLSKIPSFNQSFTGLAGLNQSFFNKHGLNKVSTMELMKETADEDEIQDLEDLFHLWDEAILLYEEEEFPGDYEILNQQVENWYTYRNLVSQRLETTVNMINEQEELIDQLGDVHVDDADIVDDDDDAGSIFHVPPHSNVGGGDLEMGLKRPQMSAYSPTAMSRTKPSERQQMRPRHIEIEDSAMSSVSGQSPIHTSSPVRTGRTNKSRNLKGWGVSSTNSTTSPVPVSPIRTVTADGGSSSNRRHHFPSGDGDDDDVVLTGSPVRATAGMHDSNNLQQTGLFARDVGDMYAHDDEDIEALLANAGVWEDDAAPTEDDNEESGLLSPDERDRYRIRK